MVAIDRRETTPAASAGFVMNLGDELTDRHVREGHGDDVALRFVGRDQDPEQPSTDITYRQLAADANRFANVLRELGVGPGDAVFVLCGRVPELYAAVIGALKAGCTVCPLFSAFGPEPIVQRMALGHARVLVTSATLYRRKVLPVRDRPELHLDHVLLVDADRADVPPGTASLQGAMERVPARFTPAATTSDTPGMLHFTSGTTGTPKGAVHVHGALDAIRRTTEEVLGVRRGDTYWCTADPGWVTGSSYGIIGPLAVGATVVVDEADFDAERWYRILGTRRVAVWYTAPTAIRMLMRAGAELAAAADLTHVRSAFSVGEPLGADAVDWSVTHLGVPFRDTWWQTETGSIMIATAFDAPVRPGSMGRCVAAVHATVLATDLDGAVIVGDDGHVREITDPDTAGMIALRPGWSSMFRTYLDAPERYAASFVDGWYLSGDLARRDADGCFWFVGRADDVIKTAGHLIGPFEVECVLNAHPAVAASGVYAVPDPIAGSLIHACVVLVRGEHDTPELQTDLVAHARRHLGAALAPRRIAVVDRLPVTRSGKVMRRLLRARELGLPEGDVSTLEQPQSEQTQSESEQTEQT
jgi:acetyl-CoA synthetase